MECVSPVKNVLSEGEKTESVTEIRHTPHTEKFSASEGGTVTDYHRGIERDDFFLYFSMFHGLKSITESVTKGV